MSATHSALTHELSPGPVQPVAAIVYANEAYPDAIFNEIVVGAARSVCRSLASCNIRLSRAPIGAATCFLRI